MKPGRKTKAQLLDEISELKRKMADLDVLPGPVEGRALPIASPAGAEWKEPRTPVGTECDLLIRILGVMNDAIFLIGPRYTFDYANPIAEREFGPINGRKCFEYFQNRSDVCPWCEKEAIVGGRSRRRVYKEAKSDKSYDVFETPIQTADGQVCKLAVLHDITRHRKAEKALKLDEVRFEALVKLSRMSGDSAAETARFALEQAVRLTRSKIGFIGVLDESESAFTLHVVSGKAAGRCEAGAPPHFLIEESGVWAEAVRQRKPVCINSFVSSDKPAVQLPPGHPKITRLLSIPVFHAGRIVSVAAVANKAEDYDNSDQRQFILLMDSLWKLMQREKDREKLRESEERMRFLAAKLLDFLEEERARLAHEIHENIGQMLAAMKFGAENALKSAEEGRFDKTVPLLASYVDMLKGAVGKARDIYMNLRPTVLDDFGVIAAIFWLSARFQEAYPHIVVDKELDVEEAEIPKGLKLPIFRVIQEALNNSAAHSGAGRIRLTLQRDEDTLELCFTDDGAGFDLDEILSAAYTRRGLGLATMKERTQLSGGSFFIDSKRGRGTMVKAVWKVGDSE
ncbi:MAG: GAF domain-containing sensor histidine kinase [Syntrophobacteraceae bacterium]